MRIPPPLSVDAQDVHLLREWITDSGRGAARARRARIVLLSAQGFGPSAIAGELRCSKQTVITWRERYRADGLPGLRDAPRSGRPSTVDALAVVRRTLESPGSGSTRWSTRRLAAELGISNVAVANVWRTWGITPDVGGLVRLTTEPAIEVPVRAVAGMYLDRRVRLLAVLVEAGRPGRDGSIGAAAVPVEERPVPGSRLATIDAGARHDGGPDAVAGFLNRLDAAVRPADPAAAPGLGFAPVVTGASRLGLLVDEPDDAVWHWARGRPEAVLYRVPARLAWDRLVRVTCLVAGASSAGAASVERLRRAVQAHPLGRPFSWQESVATDVQEGRPHAGGSETSFTDEHHSNGSAKAAGARIQRNSRSFSE